MWASITVVKWKWKFLEKLFQILPQSSSISGHRNTEVQLYFLHLQTLNFCKILVCIQVLTPDLTLSGPLQPCQVTVIINLPPGTLPDMDIALVEVTVQAADHLSWSAGKNKSNPSRAQGQKGLLSRQDSSTSIWQWQQHPLHIPTSQSSGEPHLQKSLPVLLSPSLIKLQRVNKKYCIQNILMSLNESIGHFRAVLRYFKSRSLLWALHIFSQYGFVWHFTQGQSPEIYSRSPNFNQIQITCLKKTCFNSANWIWNNLCLDFVS